MDNFVNRLEFLLKHYELSASNFADKIMVQRSSLSHILSERNKPSLDFIMKIYDSFPELNLYWLLKGEGDFMKDTKNKSSNQPLSLFTDELNDEKIITTNKDLKKEEKVKNEDIKIETTKEKNEIKKICSNKEIEQIVIFYKDGSFSSYSPNLS